MPGVVDGLDFTCREGAVVERYLINISPEGEVVEAIVDIPNPNTGES